MNARALKLLAAVLLVGGFQTNTALAQERFPRVQYLAGRPELLKPTEVTLVLDNRELRAEQTVYQERGPSAVHTLFTIPLANIVAIGASPRNEPSSLVLTNPPGLSPSPNHDEFVTLTLQFGDRIEAVAFRVERQQSASIAAKIELAADKAVEEPPATRPAKAHSVRAPRRPLQLIKVVKRAAPPRQERARKLRARRNNRTSASYQHIERT